MDQVFPAGVILYLVHTILKSEVTHLDQHFQKEGESWYHLPPASSERLERTLQWPPGWVAVMG